MVGKERIDDLPVASSFVAIGGNRACGVVGYVESMGAKGKEKRQILRRSSAGREGNR